MPKLKCSVVNCGNNADEYCCLGRISVDGGANVENTCCSSFIEQSNGSNSADIPQESLSIACTAHDCRYNEESKCCADCVDVAGAGANRATETQCNTFDEG